MPKTKKIKEQPRKPTIASEMDMFRKHIDAIGNTLVAMVVVLQEITKDQKRKLEKFESKNCEVKAKGKKRTVTVPNAHIRDWQRLIRDYERFNLSRVLLPRSLLVSLISQYDAYLGRILRVIFLDRPEILNASDRKLSFATLDQFNSIESAREYILEKEIEAILRSSHADQFKWMENAFSMPLTKGLVSWPTFIELTERRNLFVHTDGVVSSQYIDICNRYGYKLDNGTQEGGRLGVPQDYFRDAHCCIYEIGVKLGHVLWRKLFPDERKDADSHLLSLTYDLIEQQSFDLAIRLLDFACEEIKSFSSEELQLMLIVNRAQAYRWKGQDSRCRDIMQAVDWTAKSDQFRMADAVLAQDWQRATSLMARMGKDGPISSNDYRYWPLFRELRKQDEFLSTYQSVFLEPFPKRSEVQKEQGASGVTQNAMSPPADVDEGAP